MKSLLFLLLLLNVLHSCELLLLMLVSLLNIYVLSTVLLPTFLLSDSGGPTAVVIHDIPFVPATVIISAVNNVPAVADLHPRSSIITFSSNPTFASIPSVLAVLLLLSFLLLLAFLLLWAVPLTLAYC